MKRTIQILALLTLLSACGKHTIDSELDTYVKAFESDSKAYGSEKNVDYDVKFGEVSGGDTEGKCHSDVFNKSVTIDRGKWDLLSPDSRKVLIYHELGHCSLDREHKDDQTTYDYTYTVPASIMNSKVPEGTTFLSHEKDYLTELFQSK